MMDDDGVKTVKEQAVAVKEQAVAAVEKPVNAWRQTIAAEGAVVAKPTRRHRAAIFHTYLIGAVAAFVILAILAKMTPYFTFDVAITRAVQGFNPGWFDALMRTLTWIGFAPESYVITLVILVFLYVSGLKWETVVTLAGVSSGTALGIGIKVLVERPRPSANLVNVLNQLKDYSFPSGHVLFFTALFGFLLFLAYTLLKHSWWRSGLLVLLVGMIAGSGPSRIYVGQHWPSDVVASYLLGSVWLALSVLVYRWGKPRFFVNQPVAKETPDLTPEPGPGRSLPFQPGSPG